MAAASKSALARTLGIARSTLYYASIKDHKDWVLKVRIEALLREHPDYGSRSIRDHLKLNRKGIQRVMRKYGLKPHRRGRKKKWRKKKETSVTYVNLLLTAPPSYQGHIWAADFTEVWYHGRWVYVATVIDLYTREIVGLHASLRKGAPLTIAALGNALLYHGRPKIFHSDNGKEYEAKSFICFLTEFGVTISRSHPGCPWENGYQESFYGKFKVSLGDPNRFRTLGELVAEIYRTVWVYNNTRVHSAHRMPPAVFVRTLQRATIVA